MTQVVNMRTCCVLQCSRSATHAIKLGVIDAPREAARDPEVIKYFCDDHLPEIDRAALAAGK